MKEEKLLTAAAATEENLTASAAEENLTAAAAEKELTAAAATEEEVTLRYGDDAVPEPTAEQAASAEKIAQATPDGDVRAIVPIEGDDRYVTREEAEEMARNAYLEGRNEAVRAQIAADTTIVRHDNPEQAQAAGELLAIVRRSVWDL